MDPIKVGRSIAFLRKRYNMTQKRVADYLGVSDKAVSKWERGLGMPDISLLSKLSATFDTDIESILEGNLASMDMHWAGLLILDYAKPLQAQTLLYDKPIVYVQLSYILLAGIQEIFVLGKEEDINFLKKKIGTGSTLGIHLNYYVVKRDVQEESKALQTAVWQNISGLHGLMLITGADFIYGKDVTKTFRRILYSNGTNNIEMDMNLHLSFQRSLQQVKAEKEHFGRGVLAFPIQSIQELLDASNIAAIVQERQHETIADLREIALNRGFTMHND